MIFFDPSFLVVAEANEKAPAADVERQPDKKRAAPFNPNTGQGSKEQNAPLPPPPDKTTAPRSVDEEGSPKPVDPAQLPSGMTDIPLERDLPAQVDDDEEPKSKAKAPDEKPDRRSFGYSRSPWGDGTSGIR